MKKYVARLANKLTETGGPSGAFTAARWLRDHARLEAAVEAYADCERMCIERQGRACRWLPGVIAERAWCLVALDRFEDGVKAYEAALEARTLHDDAYKPTVIQLEADLEDARLRVAAPFSEK